MLLQKMTLQAALTDMLNFKRRLLSNSHLLSLLDVSCSISSEKTLLDSMEKKRKELSQQLDEQRPLEHLNTICSAASSDQPFESLCFNVMC